MEQKAFVDSGAQTTIMSAQTAEQCNIMHLLDKKMAGMAHGVGTGKILGRIHQVRIEVQGQHIPVAITVMEQESMPFLFGLDNMRRFRCCIDLEKNELRFSSEGIACPFLSEAECFALEDERMPKKQKKEGGEEGDLMPEPAAGTSAAGAAGAAAAPPPAVAQPPPPAPSTAPGNVVWTQPPAAGVAPAPEALQQPPAAARAPPSADAAKVQQLVALGFPPAQARAALQQAGGNVEVAASLLFNASGLGF